MNTTHPWPFGRCGHTHNGSSPLYPDYFQFGAAPGFPQPTSFIMKIDNGWNANNEYLEDGRILAYYDNNGCLVELMDIDEV